MITIVYDNQLHDEALKSGWGFSCLVKYSGKKVLFDTGGDEGKLLFNLKALAIDPQDVDAIALSHNHWDHTAGVEALIGEGYKGTFYFGRSFPEEFKQRLKKRNIKFFPVGEITQVAPGIFTGPQMQKRGPEEISLTVQTPRGLVIITGCAHPGIVEIVREIKEILNKDIYLVMGGFHLEISLGLGKIISEFKALGVKKVGPCHCSGQRAINLFEQKFGKDFIRIGTGLSIEL